MKNYQFLGVTMSNLLLFSLLFTAEAKKNKGGDEAKTVEAPVAEVKKETKAGNVPDDKTSAKFAAKLLETTGRNFSPNAEGLQYKAITFSADNTFTAQAALVVMDEEMECTESGTWDMDPAKSNTIANMSWNITATDCPTREAGSLRVEVELVDSESGMFTKFR